MISILVTAVGSLVGCRPAAVPAQPRVTVRLSALLPLHPSWEHVRSLDRTIASVGTLPTLTPPVAPPPLPAAFVPPQSVPASLVRERLARAAADADRYLRQLAEFLRLRNQDLIARERKLEKVRIATEVAAARARIDAEVRSVIGAQWQELSRELYRLGFREVAINSQVKSYTDQPLQDALRQQTLVRAQIATLENRRTQLNATINPTIEANLQPERGRAQAASDERIRLRTEAFEKELQARLAAERTLVGARPDPIAPIGSALTPLPNPRETPLTLVSSAQSATLLQRAQAQTAAAAARQRTNGQAERNRLIAAIRADTEQAAEQIARQQKWTLVPENSPNARDETETIASHLREQWQQRPQ